MPKYVAPFPTETLENDIKTEKFNPFIEPVLEEGSIKITQELSLDCPSNLPDGEGTSYKRPYNKNLFSASTTAGYTNMKQVTFIRHTNQITGYQIGIPKI